MSSPYNFDIQLQALKCYDKLGLSSSYWDAYLNLGIKGVQFETLGFLYQKHAIKWLSFSQVNSVLQKNITYLHHFADDMAGNKKRAVDDSNYEQLANFVEYEAYLDNSYLTKLQMICLRRSKQMYQQVMSNVFMNKQVIPDF